MARRGQSTTELALIAPFLAIVLLGIIEVSGAYGAKMDLQQASAQAARTGALEGNAGVSSVACATTVVYKPANTLGLTGTVTTDPVDLDMVNAVLNTRGVNLNNISQIQIYDATADGSTYGNAVNTYVPPFVTTAISGSKVITGAYSLQPTQPWPSCQRHPDEASDSVGVRVAYTYHPVTPLFGRASLAMTDSTIQRLNPSQGTVPCPIPGAPINVSVSANPPAPFPLTPTAGSNDLVSWAAVPLASTYSVYHSIGALNGGQFDTTPVWTGAGTVTAGQVQATINITNQAPTEYEVTGTNYCGEGQRSIPVDDGRPDAAATATAGALQTATAAAGQTATAAASAATATSVAATVQAQSTSVAATAAAATASANSTAAAATASANSTAAAATAAATANAAAATATATACLTPPKPTIGAITFSGNTDTIPWSVAIGSSDTWVITQTIGASQTAKTVGSLPLSTTWNVPAGMKASYVVQGVNLCGKSGTPSASKSDGRP